MLPIHNQLFREFFAMPHTLSSLAPMRRCVAAVALGLVLTACSGGGGGGSGNVQQPLSSTETNPSGDSTLSAKIIDNEDLSPGLRGVDANANGIRNDIDRLTYAISIL